MSQDTLSVFEHTIEMTHVWLHDVMEALGWSDQQRAYRALRSVLHGVRDRLGVDEAAHLAAQLPMLIRGVYYEGYHPADKPLRERTKEGFLVHIKAEFPDDSFSMESVTRAVLQVLAKHVTPGVTDKVKANMPAELRSLWP